VGFGRRSFRPFFARAGSSAPEHTLDKREVGRFKSSPAHHSFQVAGRPALVGRLRGGAANFGVVLRDRQRFVASAACDRDERGCWVREPRVVTRPCVSME
jgi:hypothetical protein